MAHTVTEHDLRAMVEVIDQARHDTAPCGLPPAVFELTQRLIACDLVSFCEMEPGARRELLVKDSISGPLSGVNERDPDSDPFWVRLLPSRWDSARHRAVGEGIAARLCGVSQFIESSLPVWGLVGIETRPWVGGYGSIGVFPEGGRADARRPL